MTVANENNLDDCIRAAACSYNQNIGSAAPQPDDSFVVGRPLGTTRPETSGQGAYGSFNASPHPSNGTTATSGGSGLLTGTITSTVSGIATAVQSTVNSVGSALRKPLGAKPSAAKAASGRDAG